MLGLFAAAGGQSLQLQTGCAHTRSRPSPTHWLTPSSPLQVFFAIHAAVLTLITLVQCCVHDRGGQVPSRLSLIATGVLVALAAAYGGSVLVVGECVTDCRKGTWLRCVGSCRVVGLGSGWVGMCVLGWMEWALSSLVAWVVRGGGVVMAQRSGRARGGASAAG